MRASVITVAGLCASVFALPDEYAKRQVNPSIASILASISSLEALLLPPASIAAELTGVPASVTSALSNPSAIAALESEFIVSIPAWFTSLPAEAQSYLENIPAKYSTILPQIISLEVAAGLTTLGGGATGTGIATATPTASGNGTTSATGTGKTTTAATTGGSSTGGSSSKAASTSAAASSTSKAGAAPTNALAAGIMGAVGFLGMALAL